MTVSSSVAKLWSFGVTGRISGTCGRCRKSYLVPTYDFVLLLNSGMLFSMYVCVYICKYTIEHICYIYINDCSTNRGMPC